MHSPSAQADI